MRNEKASGLISELDGIMSKCKMIDLSHEIEEGMPAAPSHSYFYRCEWNSYRFGDLSNSGQLILHEHTGTHVDAPAHFFAEGRNNIAIDAIDLKSFMAPGVVIDMSQAIPKDLLIKKEDVLEWERKNGYIPLGYAVFFYTGWSKLWHKRPDHLNYSKDWPGVDGSVAGYLVDKKAKIVGIDTFSIDSFTTMDFPAHKILLSNKILILECLNNLDIIRKDAYIVCLPLKIKDGSASPVRVVAFSES